MDRRELDHVVTQLRRLPQAARRTVAVGIALRARLDVGEFLAIVGLDRF